MEGGRRGSPAGQPQHRCCHCPPHSRAASLGQGLSPTTTPTGTQGAGGYTGNRSTQEWRKGGILGHSFKRSSWPQQQPLCGPKGGTTPWNQIPRSGVLKSDVLHQMIDFFFVLTYISQFSRSQCYVALLGRGVGFR